MTNASSLFVRTIPTFVMPNAASRTSPGCCSIIVLSGGDETTRPETARLKEPLALGTAYTIGPASATAGQRDAAASPPDLAAGRASPRAAHLSALAFAGCSKKPGSTAALY